MASQWQNFCELHGSCMGHAHWLMLARCAQVFLLSAPVQGQPLTHGTFPAVENFFVRDLCIRLKPERSPRSGRATPVATDRNLPCALPRTLFAVTFGQGMHAA